MSDVDYSALSRDELLELAEERELSVEGTGANGYVSKDDLVAALEQTDPGDTASDQADSNSDGAGGKDSGRSSSDAGVRTTQFAWWCPKCDHSQTHLIARCTNCGYQRPDAPAEAA